MATEIRRFNEYLAQLEQRPVRNHPTQEKLAVVLEGEEQIARSYQGWVQEAHALRVRNTFERGVRPNAEMQEALDYLERQEIALNYRAGVEAPEARDFNVLSEALTAILERYKRNPKLYPGGNGQLTQLDRTQINAACRRFPAFVEALIARNPDGESDDAWTTEFVKFCLRSCGASGLEAAHWVEIFVKYPNEVQMLMDCTLDKRLGAVNPGFLNIVRQEDNTEALCIKMHGQWVKVQGLKQDDVTFPSLVSRDTAPYVTQVHSVYRIMKEKTHGYGPLEVFEQVNGEEAGILNFNPIQLGSFNPAVNHVDEIDLSAENWVQNLPAWRVLNMEQLQERYAGQVNWSADLPHEQRFGMAMCATRQIANRDIDGTHGFCEFIIPEPGKEGQYRVLPMGFQPPVLPNGLIERVRTLYATQACRLHFADESGYLSQRQRYAEFEQLSPQEFERTRAYLQRFIERSRAGKEYFQLTGNSCGYHVQKVYDRVIGARFYLPFRTLAEQLFPDRDVRIEMKSINRGLNDEVMHQLASDVVNRLLDNQNIDALGNLLSSALQTLAHSLKENQPLAELQISPDAAREKIEALFRSNPAQAREILANDMVALIKLTFTSQQFYKTSIFEAQLHSPYISSIFESLQNMVWEWARDVLFALLCFILLSFRGYTYTRTDGTQRTVRVWNHPLYQRHMFNLPAMAFERPAMKQTWTNEVRTILEHLG